MTWLEKHITLHEHDDAKAERENAFTHFFGAIVAIIGLFLVIIKSINSPSTQTLKIGMIVFAITNILLYSASGLYHYLPKGDLKRLCRILDHSNIYFLIAGTYTPIMLSIGSATTISVTIGLWVFCFIGIAFTIIFWGKLNALHVILYLIMGWCIVFFWNDTVPYLAQGLLPFILAGGVSYTIGIIFYANKKMPHYHAIWHCFVLLGSAWFYIGFYLRLL